MTDPALQSRPLVLSCPLPQLFAPERPAALHAEYGVIETTDETLPDLPDATLGQGHHIINQPPLTEETLACLAQLRCIFNVESNLILNMPYGTALARGAIMRLLAPLAMPSTCSCRSTSSARLMHGPLVRCADFWAGPAGGCAGSCRDLAG